VVSLMNRWDRSLVTTELSELRARLPELTIRDGHRLRRRIEGLRGIRDRARQDATAARIAADIETAELRVAARRAAMPVISYPAELPVAQRRHDIAAAIRDHQVVVVAGETGSGKTTQLPKICLELGRGIRGQIGHTQPRRLAARTVADRIAEELGTPTGGTVGYQVRFTDSSGDDTLIKLMTDGILLAEIQSDRSLSRYDTVIIDEAHERSLNIDFLLGYLKQLLPRRPDLKVIITSATIDPQRFADHFGGAPIVEVSGRTYPVQVRHRPLEAEVDQVQGICDAVLELLTEPAIGPGDILVFLSGEREIRDTAEALSAMALPGTEVLPLYARLSTAEQHRVFAPHGGRRIVLATNVAETSLTVPGIGYVVDPGTARISRYSHRTKVQRLPIERISQASANQRTGRCGRIAPGICIRLYSEDDYLSRPEFTDPEILRTTLASVILQMAALGLGDVAAFPFLDPPDRRAIKDGLDLLHELGAIDPAESEPTRRLTDVGRSLAQLPIDPRLGRMLLAAADNGCLREVLVVAAALSIQDPRERPTDAQQAADALHARFADPTSDFLAYLNLWNHLQQQQRELSGNAFRRTCRSEFLNYLRIREWQDLHAQLRQVTRSLGLSVNDTPADAQPVHVSVLAGLLSHLGVKEGDRNEYLGPRGAKFAVFPGSTLHKKPPRWVMAAELVETSRLWARVVARIDPEWAEGLAAHLVKRSWSEPHWERDRGAVIAYEKVLLYGVPLVAARPANYGRVDPELCRALFIRHALVEGDWHTHHRFFAENQRLLDDVEELEHRARRRDIVVDDQALYDFYDRHLPVEVVSARHFDAWWKKARRDRPGLLTLTPEILRNADAAPVAGEDYPDVWRTGGLALPLSYHFEPGHPDDGVTVHIPITVLNQVSPADFDRQVPGLRPALVTAMIKSLPKALRRPFVPAPDTTRVVLERLPADGRSLAEELAEELTRLGGVPVRPTDFQLHRVPDHLRMTFQVVGKKGRTLAAGKDLVALADRLRPETTAALGAALSAALAIKDGGAIGAGPAAGRDPEAPDEQAGPRSDLAPETIETTGPTTGPTTGLTSWTIGVLPEVVQGVRGGHRITGYPALVDRAESVSVQVFTTEAEQRAAHQAGVRRLLLLNTPSPVPVVLRSLSNAAKLVLSRNPHGGVAALLADCTAAAVDAIMAGAASASTSSGGAGARDADTFATLLARVRAELADTVLLVLGEVEQVLTAANQVADQLAQPAGPLAQPALRPTLAELRGQLDELVFAGFVSATGVARLHGLRRYVQAIGRRLEKLPEAPQRDRALAAEIDYVRAEYRKVLAGLPPGRADDADVGQLRWMIEELRVSLFAQQLGTAYPVSAKRIFRVMDAL
jgi:ATP-dependent helicase HrpA